MANNMDLEYLQMLVLSKPVVLITLIMGYGRMEKELNGLKIQKLSN
jgi:hypothetical protein